MANYRVKVAAQDQALKAIEVAASAEPNKEVAAEMQAIVKTLRKRFGVSEPAPAA